MIGAVAGDMIGSVYEARPIKTKDFPLFDPRSVFTDDTVLSVAVADALLGNADFAAALRRYGRKYPRAGYGGAFIQWVHSDRMGPYQSWGNGSAMRVSPVGFAINSESEVLETAKKTAEVTHNHPEGIKGAQAAALAIFLARKGFSKRALRRAIAERFQYDLNRTPDEIRPGYRFDVSCQGSVPEAVVCFLESRSYEDAIRNAVSLGGDSDTLACITGGIAEAFYGGVPESITQEVRNRLPQDLWRVIDRFCRRFQTT